MLNKQLKEDCINIHLNPKITTISSGKGKTKKEYKKDNKFKLSMKTNLKKDFLFIELNNQIYSYNTWHDREHDVNLFIQQREVYNKAL
jgi:hypothetical protein